MKLINTIGHGLLHVQKYIPSFPKVVNCPLSLNGLSRVHDPRSPVRLVSTTALEEGKEQLGHNASIKEQGIIGLVKMYQSSNHTKTMSLELGTIIFKGTQFSCLNNEAVEVNMYNHVRSRPLRSTSSPVRTSIMEHHTVIHWSSQSAVLLERVEEVHLTVQVLTFQSLFL